MAFFTVGISVGRGDGPLATGFMESNGLAGHRSAVLDESWDGWATKHASDAHNGQTSCHSPGKGMEDL
jgi:hypothetical protein